MHLVEACASGVQRQVGEHFERADLVAWGVTGLLEAAERYDPAVGAAFATFAHYRIHGAIYDGLRQMGRLPHRLYRGLSGPRRAGRAGLPAGHAAGEPGERYGGGNPALAALVVTLDEGNPPRDLNHGGPRADQLLAQKRLHAELRAAVAGLPDRERHFIEKCYFEAKSVTEAGQELGLSKSWSSRLHARALAHLRRALTAPASRRACKRP